jgi:MFS family permease
MTMTIVGDLYSVEERAKAQGYLASVWGMAAIVGPTLGGVFSEYISWRWIFFVNVPVAGAAMWMLMKHFHETVERRRHRIDYLGTALLTVGCTAVILALLEGGEAWAWRSATTAALIGIGIVTLCAFGLVERVAAEPVVPPWIMSRRILVAGNLTSLAVGALLIGLTSFLPTFAQGVLGHGALAAGFALAAMTVGWPLAAAFAGSVYLRIGFRNTGLLGSSFVLVGSGLTLLLGEHSTLVEIGAYCFVIGFGLGWVASPTVVAVQTVVGWERRGVVTGTNLFARSIGSAVGVAAFGAIVNTRLGQIFASPPSDVHGRLPTTADDAEVVLDRGSGASAALREYVRSALNDSLHLVFVGVTIVALLTVVAVIAMPAKTEELRFDEDENVGGQPAR